jgi:hypothetical protein
MEAMIDALSIEQFVVTADFDNPAAIKYHNPIGFAYRTEAVRDNNRGARSLNAPHR